MKMLTLTLFVFFSIVFNVQSQEYGGDFANDSPYRRTHSRVTKDGKWGISEVSNYEKIVVNAEYAYVFAKVVWNKLILVNTNGKLSKYAESTVFGGKYGYIDISGKEITQMKYDWADRCVVAVGTKQEKGYGENEFVTVYGGKWGAIDSLGKEFISPGTYTFLHPEKFETGKYFFYANKGGVWKKGENGYYQVKGGTWQILDEKGKFVKKLDCDYVECYPQGSANIYKSGNYGSFDFNNKVEKWKF